MIEDDYKFVEAARSYIGVPWRHQGRNRAGIDCVGLVILAANKVSDLNIPMEADYARTPDYRRTKRLLTQYGERVGSSGVGYVLIYKSTAALHMAIDTGTGTVIQALNTIGRVTESPLNFPIMQYWRFTWRS